MSKLQISMVECLLKGVRMLGTWWLLTLVVKFILTTQGVEHRVLECVEMRLGGGGVV